MTAATNLVCRHSVPRGYMPDWQCERRRFHLGRHRWRNYTRPRFPHFWNVDQWRRTIKCNRRLRRYEKGCTAPMLMSHRAYLFPARFDPVPIASREADLIHVIASPGGLVDDPYQAEALGLASPGNLAHMGWTRDQPPTR